jgi:hypothetical protein
LKKLSKSVRGDAIGQLQEIKLQFQRSACIIEMGVDAKWEQQGTLFAHGIDPSEIIETHKKLRAGFKNHIFLSTSK